MNTSNKHANDKANQGRARIVEMATAFGISRCIMAAASLGIADHLDVQPRTLSELATLTGSNPQALERLLAILVSVQILHKDASGCYQLDDSARCMVEGTDGCIRDWLALCGEHWYPASAALDYTLQTGNSAFEHLKGESVYAHLAKHPDKRRRFDIGIGQLSQMADADILDSIRLDRNASVVDVGGGNGQFVKALLSRYPEVHARLMEKPEALPNAEAILAAEIDAGCCELVPGDFFVSVPGGADIYVLRNVLNDWGDEQAKAILVSCRKAMRADSRLLIVLRLRSEEGLERFPALVHLSRMLMFGGEGSALRSFDELNALCDAAGLVCSTPRRTGPASAMQVVEARVSSPDQPDSEPVV